ncbi:uroporphyrinogen decarboxylase [Formosa sp. PL04]|uniref:uroporphyrinogen decarboxylase n=1 Tax=Formosa sp. PL04 TaxID=3081755 RepID=UPI00298159B3|nr:uroporphyrinogen decarboxylase [Formosa sp. PL04]MDW5288849.1 uroporphyrinogen decarboxylase [Formosa sp. PL04]
MDVLGISATEWVGYLASFVLLISFTMKDVIKLRIVNSVGCALFVAYGFMLQTSWPVVITNGSIMLINAYYLFLKKK